MKTVNILIVSAMLIVASGLSWAGELKDLKSAGDQSFAAQAVSPDFSAILPRMLLRQRASLAPNSVPRQEQQDWDMDKTGRME